MVFRWIDKETLTECFLKTPLILKILAIKCYFLNASSIEYIWHQMQQTTIREFVTYLLWFIHFISGVFLVKGFPTTVSVQIAGTHAQLTQYRHQNIW